MSAKLPQMRHAGLIKVFITAALVVAFMLSMGTPPVSADYTCPNGTHVPFAGDCPTDTPSPTSGSPGCYQTNTDASVSPSPCGTSGPASTAVADGLCFMRTGSSGTYGQVACSSITLSAPTTPVTDTENDCDKADLSKDNCNIVKYLIITINAFSTLVGVVVIASIIAGGIQYASAADNPDKMQAAKHRITQALIALVIFIFMFAFLQWVIPGGIF